MAEALLGLALEVQSPGISGRPSELGQKFVRAIQSTVLKVVANSETGMMVWELGSDLALPIVVLRKEVRVFWEEMAVKLEANNHVVIIGSPGVGKSSTHPYLLKLLLEKRRPVVFLKRDVDRGGKYYEFLPSRDGSYTAFEYKEKDVDEDTIASLKDHEAFLIIEPLGQRSPPPAWIKARVALVCSPNRQHYQGMEKTGMDQFGAIFRYFPHWSLDELLEARPYICDISGKPIVASSAEVKVRFLRFGAIPRHVFAVDITRFESLQVNALLNLRESTLKLIMEARSANKAVEIDGSDDSSPSSYAIAYESEHPFSSRSIVMVSDYVEREVWKRHLSLLWRQVEWEVPQIARLVFESYCRDTLAKKVDVEYTSRRSVGKSEPEQGLGHYSRSQEIWSILRFNAKLQDAELHPIILYHALSDTQELVDALVMREDGGVDGFQFTLGGSHLCQTESLKRFALKLGTKERPFRLYNVVPSHIFAVFRRTKPETPQAENAEVYILSMPPPQEN